MRPWLTRQVRPLLYTAPYHRTWQWHTDLTLPEVVRVGVIAIAAGGIIVLFFARDTATRASVTSVNARDEAWYTYQPIAKPVQSDEVRSLVVWPIHGPVTDEFGTLELFRWRLGLGRHSGIDIAARTGEPVTPFKSGTVSEVVTSGAGGCGQSVTVDHGNDLTSMYCHLSSVDASVGAAVNPGDTIGRVGSTGVSTGPHLHFEVRKAGKPVDPRSYVNGSPTVQ